MASARNRGGLWAFEAFGVCRQKTGMRSERNHTLVSDQRLSSYSRYRVEVIACILGMSVLWQAQPAFSWRFELIEVGGYHRVEDGAGNEIREDTQLGHVERSLSSSAGTGYLSYDLAVSADVFSYVARTAATGVNTGYHYVAGTCRPFVELMTIADDGDQDSTYVSVRFSGKTTSSCNYEAAIRGFLNIGETQFSAYCGQNDSSQVFDAQVAVGDSTIIRLFDYDDDMPVGSAFVYASVRDFFSCASEAIFDLSVRINQCGTGTPECPKPVVLLVTGWDVGIFTSRYDLGLLILASATLSASGWQPEFLPSPTKAELYTALSSPCVRGLHISAHGTGLEPDGSNPVSNRSNIWLKNTAGTGGEEVTAAELGAVVGDRRLDFIAPLACNQYEDKWRAAFPNVGKVILPLGNGPGGSHAHSGRYILPSVQYTAASAGAFSINSPACPDKVLHFATSHAARVWQGVSRECSAFRVCDEDGCGHDLYPAIACAENVDLPMAGAIGVSAADGSFEILAHYAPGHADTTIVDGTTFAAIPSHMMPGGGWLPYRHIAVNSVTTPSDVLPVSFQVIMRYEDADLASAGIGDEASLLVYWVSGEAGGSFVPASVDTVLDEVSFSVLGSGVGGIYGVGVTGVPTIRRSAATLYDAIPNPFNPRTTIKFDLPEGGPVRLSVFDVAGRLVRTLVDDTMPQGSHEAVWDGRDSSGREVASGSYLARLEFGGKVETVRMGLIR